MTEKYIKKSTDLKTNTKEENVERVSVAIKKHSPKKTINLILTIIIALTIVGCSSDHESLMNKKDHNHINYTKENSLTVDTRETLFKEPVAISNPKKVVFAPIATTYSTKNGNQLHDQLIDNPTMQNGSYWCWAIVGQKIINSKDPSRLVPSDALVPYDGRRNDIRSELQVIIDGSVYFNVQQKDYLDRLEKHLQDRTNNSSARIQRSYWGDMNLTNDYLNASGIRVSLPVSNAEQSWVDNSGMIRYYFDPLTSSQLDAMDRELDSGKMVLTTFTPGRQDIGGHSIVILRRSSDGSYVYHDTWTGENYTASRESIQNGLYLTSLRRNAAIKTYQTVG